MGLADIRMDVLGGPARIADLIDHPLAALVVDVGDHHGGAFAREGPRGRRPDPHAAPVIKETLSASLIAVPPCDAGPSLIAAAVAQLA